MTRKDLRERLDDGVEVNKVDNAVKSGGAGDGLLSMVGKDLREVLDDESGEKDNERKKRWMKVDCEVSAGDLQRKIDEGRRRRQAAKEEEDRCLRRDEELLRIGLLKGLTVSERAERKRLDDERDRLEKEAKICRRLELEEVRRQARERIGEGKLMIGSEEEAERSELDRMEMEIGEWDFEDDCAEVEVETSMFGVNFLEGGGCELDLEQEPDGYSGIDINELVKQ